MLYVYIYVYTGSSSASVNEEWTLSLLSTLITCLSHTRTWAVKHRSRLSSSNLRSRPTSATSHDNSISDISWEDNEGSEKNSNNNEKVMSSNNSSGSSKNYLEECEGLLTCLDGLSPLISTFLTSLKGRSTQTLGY